MLSSWLIFVVNPLLLPDNCGSDNDLDQNLTQRQPLEHAEKPVDLIDSFFYNIRVYEKALALLRIYIRHFISDFNHGVNKLQLFFNFLQSKKDYNFYFVFE